ncbi:MAG TPA: CHRD domain-containing protein [Gallionella sp.]|nr:CHRD domain-containing protein [Gallionella sp.]
MNSKKSLYSFMILCASILALAAYGAIGTSQTWYIPASAALTDSQIASFDAQGLYFNVHSAANPGGEIRGQIVPSPPGFVTDAGTPSSANTFSTLLSGDQEVPANTSQASGYGTVVLDPLTKTLSGVLVTNGIDGTAAHIHSGLTGMGGPIVIPLAGGPTVWTVPSGTVLTDAQIADLAAGSYYFNVHSAAAPGGEIRGQLSQQLRFAALSGANEVPAVTTAASGAGVLSFNPMTGQISGFVQTSGIAGVAAHIHQAAAGTNGGVIVPLTETPPGSGRWVVPAGSTLTAAQAVSLNTNGLYVNVHSAAYPGGEIRGQLLAATVKIGNAMLDGTQEVPAVTTAAGGSGILVLNSITRQVYGNISTSGIAGTLAHVHEAAAGMNGPVVIPLSLTPPPATFQIPLAIPAI